MWIDEYVKHVAQFDNNLQDKKEEFAKAISNIAIEQIKEMFSSYKVAFQNGYLVIHPLAVRYPMNLWGHIGFTKFR